MAFNRFVSSFLAGAAALVAVAGSARAQEEAPKPPEVEAPKPRFGDGGQFALSLNEQFNVDQSEAFSGGELQGSYFVVRHLSLGLALGAQWITVSTPPPTVGGQRGVTEFVFHVGPRIGYDLAFSDYVSLWPQVGVDYRMVQAGTSGLNTGTASAFGLTILAPLLIHPTRGFFVGAGPAFYTEFSNKTNSGGQSFDNGNVTSFGLMATIGGAI